MGNGFFYLNVLIFFNLQLLEKVSLKVIEEWEIPFFTTAFHCSTDEVFYVFSKFPCQKLNIAFLQQVFIGL